MFFDKSVSVINLWRLLPPSLTTKKDPWVLGIDGTWLHRNGVVMIYRDVTHSENLFWSYHLSESYEAIRQDLEALMGLLGDDLPSGIISDWKGSIVSGVKLYFPGIPHQRCLIHVVREAERWLPMNSGFLAVSVLRRLSHQLLYLRTKDDKTNWLAQLIKWEKLYGHRLTERTINDTGTGKKWWYTHGNLRRAWRLLTDDWYPFFVYLDHPFIPTSNNSLEGVNGQMKRNLGNHRGMKTPQQVSFLFWYLIFARTKTKQDLKKLWALWKTQKSLELDTQYFT